MSNFNLSPKNPYIGYVVGGSLKDNLRVRLTLPPQKVQEGAFVVIESGDWQFYGLVTDLQLGATDPRFADEQSGSACHAAWRAAARADALHQPGSAAGPDAGKRSGAGRPGCLRAGAPATPEDPHRARSRPSPRTMHRSAAGRSPVTWPRFLVARRSEGSFVIGETREQGHPGALT
jgi:uncharacterized protein